MLVAARVALLALLAFGSVTCYKSNKEGRSDADRVTANNKNDVKELITAMLDIDGNVVGVLKTTAHYPEDTAPDDSYSLLNKIPFAIKNYLDKKNNKNYLSNTIDSADYDGGLAVPKHQLVYGKTTAKPNKLFSQRMGPHYHVHNRNVKQPGEFKGQASLNRKPASHGVRDSDTATVPVSRGNKIHADVGNPLLSRSKGVRTHVPSAQGTVIYPISASQRTGSPLTNFHNNINTFPVLQQSRTPYVISGDNLRTYGTAQDSANYFSGVQDARNPFIASQGAYNPYPNIQASNPYVFSCHMQCANNPFLFNSDMAAWALLKCYQDCCNAYYGNIGGYYKNVFNNNDDIYTNARSDDGDFDKSHVTEKSSDEHLKNGNNLQCDEFNNCDISDADFDDAKDATENFSGKVSNDDYHDAKYETEDFSGNVSDDHYESKYETEDFSGKISDDHYESKYETEDFSGKISDDHYESKYETEDLSDKLSDDDYDKSDSREYKEEFSESDHNKRIFTNAEDYKENKHYDDSKRDFDTGFFHSGKFNNIKFLNNENYYRKHKDIDNNDNDIYKGDIIIDNIVLI